jgi:Coenzyme PQQ synthesis protein D (PqqD)
MYYTTQVPMVVSRQFDTEVIIANFETGLYYSLTGTAADIWLGLESGASVDEIIRAFVALGTDDVEASKQLITSFIENLLNEKIIMPCVGVPPPQPWSPQFGKSFSLPVLDRFDDLRELLFLDPVHDVSEAGWPVVKDGV